MPLREVKFSKKFPYDSFLNYDLGYVWDMEEGETREEIEDKLLKMANDNHRRNYPQFYQQTPNYSHPISEINNYTTIDRSALTPIEEPKISPEQEIANTMKKSHPELYLNQQALKTALMCKPVFLIPYSNTII